jgi:hypothetical protein
MCCSITIYYSHHLLPLLKVKATAAVEKIPFQRIPLYQINVRHPASLLQTVQGISFRYSVTAVALLNCLANNIVIEKYYCKALTFLIVNSISSTLRLIHLLLIHVFATGHTNHTTGHHYRTVWAIVAVAEPSHY